MTPPAPAWARTRYPASHAWLTQLRTSGPATGARFLNSPEAPEEVVLFDDH